MAGLSKQPLILENAGQRSNGNSFVGAGEMISLRNSQHKCEFQSLVWLLVRAVTALGRPRQQGSWALGLASLADSVDLRSVRLPILKSKVASA